ncbi:MAG: DUF5069 domain-containing protein [Akkermansiaceae bacterium]|nr:DUF5069 domain-containing protein [Akkermansiaceae bacterium]
MSNPVKEFAPDLTQAFPRSPRETLAGYVVAARTLDKCRAVVAGTEGEYHYDCPLDSTFFDFTGIDSGEFKAKVESGATDEEMEDWIREHSKIKDDSERIQWNNKMRYTRPCDMKPELQEFLEDYIPKYVGSDRPVYVWFDVYDIEEKRL